MPEELSPVHLSDKELVDLNKDYQTSAELVSLLYVEDSIPGIMRKKTGKGKATGGDFTSKDFRTWAGTLNMLRNIKAIDDAGTLNDRKKNVLEALDKVSALLGNTRTVCKKYYVHPGIIRLYETEGLKKYLMRMQREKDEEKILIALLKKLHP